MSTKTKIQWCHTTVNPVMGCDGCELYPTLGRLRGTFAAIVRRHGATSAGVVALIERETALGAQHTKLELNRIAQAIAAAVEVEISPHARETLVTELVGEVSELYICYAAELHRLFSPRGTSRGFASAFERPELFPGRVGRVALLPAPSTQEVADKPWLTGLPRLIFLSDMGDALSRDVPFEFLREEIVQSVLSAAGKRHRWLWLTKRPQRMAEFSQWLVAQGVAWPDNLVAMTTVTGPQTIGRVAQLQSVRARYRGLSVEPLWDEVRLPLDGIDWVIVGGQSGNNALPFDLGWAERIRGDCERAGAAFFLKQLGRNPTWQGSPVALKDGHGGDWAEWPSELRNRQLPSMWREP